jgi:hypothetical protein
MPSFAGPIDLMLNELRNAVTQNLAAPPGTLKPGLRYYDTTLNYERYWDGTQWINLGALPGLGALAYLDEVTTDQIVDGTITAADIANGTITSLQIADGTIASGDIADGAVTTTQIAAGTITNANISATAAIDLSKLATDPLDRANHTGTQLAATISDFDAQVQTSRLDQMAIPTATVDLGGQTLTSVATPTVASDAANKAYVDNVATGLDVKESVRVAADTNVNIAAPGATIDGVTMAPGERVLLMGQTDATENGIYDFTDAGTAMTRSSDSDTDAEVTSGMFAFVEEGNHEDQGWILATDNPITLGTTDLQFTQFSGAGSVVGTSGRIAVTGNQVDIDAAYVGQATITTLGTVSTGTWEATPVEIAYGGTGASDATQARLNLGATSKYSSLIGDGSASTFTVTHNLGSKDVGVEVYDVASGSTVYVDVRRDSDNSVVIEGFGSAPAAGSLAVVVVG